MLSKFRLLRYARFSLFRFLLASGAIGAFAGILASILSHNQQILAEVARIESVGGYARQESQSTIIPFLNRRQIVAINVGGQTFEEDIIERLLAIGTLRELTLDDCQLSPTQVGVIQSLKHLEKLSLCGTRSGEVALEYNIPSENKLKSLSLAECDLTDDAIHKLEGLSEIESLCVADTALSIEKVSRLRLKKLKILDASYCAGDRLDLGESGLAPCTQLIALSVRGTGIRELHLEPQAQLGRLTSLDLRGTLCSIKGLAMVAPALSELAIDPVELNRETVMELFALNSLTKLVIGDDSRRRIFIDPGITRPIEIAPEIWFDVPEADARELTAMLDRLRANRPEIEITTYSELRCSLYTSSRIYVLRSKDTSASRLGGGTAF